MSDSKPGEKPESPRPEQQGDGQPENQREIEDERAGSKQSNREAQRSRRDTGPDGKPSADT